MWSDKTIIATNWFNIYGLLKSREYFKLWDELQWRQYKNNKTHQCMSISRNGKNIQQTNKVTTAVRHESSGIGSALTSQDQSWNISQLLVPGW